MKGLFGFLRSWGRDNHIAVDRQDKKGREGNNRIAGADNRDV